MIIRGEDLKKICSNILLAIDPEINSILSETISFKRSLNKLKVSITNQEYYVESVILLEDEAHFEASISAEIFLNLVSKLTTETIELTISGNNLVVKGNGEYVFPMIFDGDGLLDIPEINIENEIETFKVDSSVLKSIITHNGAEISKNKVISNPVMNMFYIDKSGCITFSSGACVNRFELPVKVKLLLNEKIVKLLKLLEGDVYITLGEDTLENGVKQLKIRFSDKITAITAIINSDEDMLNSVPEDIIRERALSDYEYSVVVDKKLLLESINRLILFHKDTLNCYANFIFNGELVEISVGSGKNREQLVYSKSNSKLPEYEYETCLDLHDLKSALVGNISKNAELRFGNNQAIVIKYLNIYNVIPEVII